MILRARAAIAAAVTFALAGFGSISSPGLAAELPTMPLGTPILEHAVATAVPALSVTPPTAEQLAADPADDDVVAYPTLAAAVAAHADDEAVDDEQLRCLAGAIYFESRGEPLAGQLAVAEVILNRAQSGRFADSLCGVVTQRGQFSFVRGGRIPAITNNANFRTAMAVAKVAMKDAWESKAGEALYFNGNRAGGTGRIRVASIGNHVFYR